MGVSALSVVQTAREILLGVIGDHLYEEAALQQRTFAFAGHAFSVADDQPQSGTGSQTEQDGTIQPLIDGQPLGPSSHARVRPGLEDLGRYHLWYDAWLFRERTTGNSTLWLARRLQRGEGDSPRFEVTVVEPDGTLQTRILRGWQLGTESRLYRATQFVRGSTWTVLPLSLGDALGYFPLLLFVFPVGTSVLGARLLKRRSR